MKKLIITLGIVCLFMTGCQAAHETIPETTMIAPIDSTQEETETNKNILKLKNAIDDYNSRAAWDERLELEIFTDHLMSS